MDYLIIGCGLTGAVIARELASKGYTVEIWERRDHIGGNLYDYVDAHGVLVHKYGPHTFHTNDNELFSYIMKFEDWDEYHLQCGAIINGKYSPTPFNFSTIDIFFPGDKGEKIKEALLSEFSGKKSASVIDAMNSKNSTIKEYADFLFENDYAPYTAKQWDVNPQEIDRSVLERVPLRFSYESGYFDDKYQVIPRHSYCKFFENLLDHPNISVRLKTVEKPDLSIPTIYTGPIDELFDYKFGKLPYRSLKFKWKYSSRNDIQPAAVVAYPQEPGYTRITEYNKLPPQKTEGTSYAVEYSIPNGGGNEPYYPVLTEASKRQYEMYKDEVKKTKNLICCGRLADFKYYNMDETIRRALDLVNNELSIF